VRLAPGNSASDGQAHPSAEKYNVPLLRFHSLARRAGMGMFGETRVMRRQGRRPCTPNRKIAQRIAQRTELQRAELQRTETPEKPRMTED
jgi:hypothetical protein